MALEQIAWVTMPILVCLHCGPLRVPDWRFAVVRAKMDEGILGKEFLRQILGLDLGNLFEKARQVDLLQTVRLHLNPPKSGVNPLLPILVSSTLSRNKPLMIWTYR
jgi:hypothetical protein